MKQAEEKYVPYAVYFQKLATPFEGLNVKLISFLVSPFLFLKFGSYAFCSGGSTTSGWTISVPTPLSVKISNNNECGVRPSMK